MRTMFPPANKCARFAQARRIRRKVWFAMPSVMLARPLFLIRFARVTRCCIGFAAFVLASPTQAAGWITSGNSAGYSNGGGFTGLTLGCTAGRPMVSFSGFAMQLQDGASYTVALTVDGTAYLFTARARSTPNAPGSVLTGPLQRQQAAGLVDALRKGKVAEVSGPAGHYNVPLSGSGKALGALPSGCLAP